MGSKEPAEDAEFERKKRKRAPSAKQKEAAEDAAFERKKRNKVPEAKQKEAAELKKRKRAPEESAAEAACYNTGLFHPDPPLLPLRFGS